MEDFIFTERNVGHCAVCSGGNLTYGDMDIHEDILVYEFICDDCKNAGQETYRMVYVDTTGIVADKHIERWIAGT